MTRFPRLIRTATALGLIGATLTACGSDDAPTASRVDSSTPTSGETEATTGSTDTFALAEPESTPAPNASTPSDSTTGDTTSPSATTASGSDDSPAEVAIDSERCEQNKAAGPITFLTGFDYAAASSIVEVIYADKLGLYDQLCLDVSIKSSFSTANYALVEGGEGTFASGGSFSELMLYAGQNDSKFAVVQIDGHEPIDTLMLKPDYPDLASVKGQTIGVKGKLPPSIQVMLSEAGLTIDTDYQTVPLDGFVPTEHYAIDSIAGFPGWRSNEPFQLEAADLPFTAFDAAAAGVPGSFGAIFTTQAFVTDHPTAAEDFVRATLRGLQEAIDNPDAAADASIELIDATGNPNYLSPDGEKYRWNTEAQIVASGTADGAVPGTPQSDKLQAELDAYAPTGLFDGVTLPSVADVVNTDLAAAVTADGTVIWPG